MKPTCIELANPQEAMLQPAAFQVLIKFAANESGQMFALAGQFGLELGPIFLNDLVEQSGLGAVAYVSCALREFCVNQLCTVVHKRQRASR